MLAFVAFPVLAQPVQGELACKPLPTDFVYDCTIRLARRDQPLAGASVTVGADMPSMPMAHNVKPVKAAPGKAPGEYQAKLELQMLGEWAVRLRLRGPVNDQLVLHYEFDEKGARPVKRTDKPPRK
ncbi:MAG: FixH family protein [Burkholderiales bacterium]